jgi:hypothetical protein
VLAQRLQRLDVIGRGRFRPRRDRAAAQGLVLVGNDEIGVDMLLDASPPQAGQAPNGLLNENSAARPREW